MIEDFTRMMQAHLYRKIGSGIVKYNEWFIRTPNTSPHHTLQILPHPYRLDVKLVKDLIPQLCSTYAYLEQHELYANEVRIMRERNQDPLAFVANQQMTPPHFNTYQSYQSSRAGQLLDEEQLTFLADPGIPAGQAQTIIPHNAAFQTEDLDTYDSDCDDLSTAQVVLTANISNYGSDVISEEKANKEHNNETITAELERYKERVKTFEQRLNIDLSSREKMIDYQMDDMIRETLALKEQVDSLEQNLAKQIKEKESALQTFAVFKNESKEKENKYMENEIDLEKKIKELDNIICKVFQSAQTVFKDQFDSIKQTRVRHKEQSDSLINKLNLKSMENEDLKAQIQDKVFVITSLKNDLQKSKGKEIVENVVHLPSATTISPGMFKLDLVPLPPRLLQNRDAHIDYLRHTQEQANTLWEIELLVYVQDTCPNAITPSPKKVAVTPMNNVKKVRFAEPLTSSSNIKQVESSNTSDSNTPVLSSTGVNCSTICGSKPPGNKKNDRISQTPSRNKKNKVEAQPRKVNKMNRVVKPVCDVDVKHSLSNANSEILCATCYPECTLVSGLWLFETHNRESLLAHELSGKCCYPRVYYVEGLGHNLFSVGQFCDADLEVAFRKNTCFIHNLEGVDLLLGSRDTNLYTISLDDMLKSSPICLLSKASKTKSWLWHRRLSHLNFGTLNKLAKDGLARGIPRLKFQKDHLCLACALEKSKKSSHQPKVEDTNQEKIYLLHMDLCGPMRVASINGKRHFVNGMKMLASRIKLLHSHSSAKWVLSKGTSGLLFQAARTMLIFSKASLFLWAEAINTACYTQNRSLIRLRYNKTPYELMQDKKPDLSFFHVFGSLCYPTNDHEDLGKFDAKADIGIFVGYAPAKKAFRIYNRRTRIITETIHVTFDELTTMASEQFSSGPRLQGMTPVTYSTRLIQEAAAPRAEVLADSPVSTSIDQDAPSTNPLNESPNEDSTPQGSSSNVRKIHTPFEHLGRWTKDHPIANMIGDPSRSVSTRKQLETDAM
ncbi:retrovirus-related pol polyprotein from transposon TNT 1-94 [Tanacetum coccineum]